LAFNISPIPNLRNENVDLLSNVAPKLIPPKESSPGQISIKLIFLPSIINNITNYRFFNDYADIINFITSDGTYDDQIIDRDIHDKELNKSSREYKIGNEFLKSIFKLEDLYDLKERFKFPGI